MQAPVVTLNLSWGLLIMGLAGSLAGQPVNAAETKAKTSPNRCRLILPASIPVVVGREMNIYFDNVVLVPNSRNYLFDVDCAKGSQQEERWTFVPQAADVGDRPLTLDVYDSDNKLIASAKTTIHVAPTDAGANREVTFLIIGDSLTHASVYPEEILTLGKTAGNPRLTLLGTHHLAGTSPENRHEGYGGWTFERFATFYSENNNPEDHGKRCSPFVFLEEGKPTLDFKRYVAEQCAGKAPAFVSIALGCNDIFGAKDDTIDAAIDKAFSFADKLLTDIHRTDPNTKIGLVTLVPPAASQDAFGSNYQCGQTRWQYRRNQHHVVERMMEKYGNREKENLYLIPAYVNLDTVHNYPAAEVAVNARSAVKVLRQINGCHPAAPGYLQMADVIYSWMKGLL